MLLTTHRIIKYLLSLGLIHEYVNSISIENNNFILNKDNTIKKNYLKYSIKL